MSSSYPTAYDSFSNPSGSDLLSSSTVPHWGQHANANDAIEAIEAELGLNPSGGNSTVAERLAAIEASVTVVGVNLWSALSDGSMTTEKLQNAAITEDKLANNAISSSKLKTDSVTSDKIRNAAISGAKIGSRTIKYSHLADPEKVVLSRVATQSLSGTTGANISFDTETTDTSGFTSTSPTATITIPAGKAGLYLVNAHISGYAGHANDYIRAVTSAGNFNGNVSGSYGSISCFVDLDDSNTIQIYCYNGSGGALSLTGRVYVLRLF